MPARTRSKHSPVAHVPVARLNRVHVALVGCEAVTDAATQWGFSPSGRFTCSYRERFGSLPSEHVRQAPSE
jgi:AraC-like DNA-binding protein